MADEIRFRRGTAAAWAASSEILDAGEPGVDTTNGFIKIGNGRDRWTQLPYAAPTGSGGGSVQHTHPAAEISDSTEVGRAVLTALDAEAARAVLNVPEDDLPSLVLLYENGLV